MEEENLSDEEHQTHNETSIQDLTTFYENYEELKKSYITRPFLNKYEKTKIISERAQQLANGSISFLKNPNDYLTFFMKIDNAKFKKKVIPGDTLIFRLDLISPIRRGLCHMHGKGFVNGKIVVEGDLLAQIARKQK